MQQNQAIIVCSVYQSETSEAIVRIIRDLCPSQEVVFQPLEKTTQFEGRKVVFCHSSYSGRLALTDVNDSIYDKAVKDANRTVGKENVAFVVTDVEAADVYLRRKMITQTQHTLVSKTSLLLLVGKVNDIDDEVLGQLKEFLTMTRLPPHVRYLPHPQKVNQPQYYELLKSIPQVACMVIAIACFASVNSRLDLLESHNNVLRKDLQQNLVSIEKTVSAEKTNLETALQKNMDDIKLQLKEELKTKMGDLKVTLTTEINTLQTELQNYSNVQLGKIAVLADQTDQKLISLQKSMKEMLEQSIDKVTLETIFQNNTKDHNAQFQNLKTNMEDMHISLRGNMLNLTSQIPYIQSGLETLITEVQRQGKSIQRIEDEQTTVLNTLQTELERHISVQRNDSTMRADDIDKKFELLQQSVNKKLEQLSSDKMALETLLQNKMNDQKVQIQKELGNKMEHMQSLLTKNMENHTSTFTTLASQIPTNIHTAIKEGRIHDLYSKCSEVISITKDIQSELTSNTNQIIEDQFSQIQKSLGRSVQVLQTLQSNTENISQLQTELNGTVHEMQTRIEARCSQLQDLKRSVQDIRTLLQKMEGLKTDLQTFIKIRVDSSMDNIKRSFEDIKTSFQDSMQELRRQLQNLETKIRDD